MKILYSIYKNIKEQTNELILAGIIQEHISRCHCPQCVCKKMKATKIMKNSEELELFIRMIFSEVNSKIEDLNLEIEYLIFKI